MAIIEQCEKCGRSLSSCPFYDKDSVYICQNYEKPIDNSRFFSNFFISKGRIGRVQYLVTVLISVAFYYLFAFAIGAILASVLGSNFVTENIILITFFCLIPSAALIIIAGLKRCHDSGADWWYAIVPVLLLFVSGLLFLMIGAVAFFFLFFQKGDEDINEYGTVPLMPYQPQIEWDQTLNTNS